MYSGQWDDSLGPIKQTFLTEIHIMQSTLVNNCSGDGGTSSSTVIIFDMRRRCVKKELNNAMVNKLFFVCTIVWTTWPSGYKSSSI